MKKSMKKKKSGWWSDDLTETESDLPPRYVETPIPFTEATRTVMVYDAYGREYHRPIGFSPAKA
jgi:hypothetical protein